MDIFSIALGLQVLHKDYEVNGVHIAPAHQGVEVQELIHMSSLAGSDVLRIPLDLTWTTPTGVPQWVLDRIEVYLQQAQSRGIKVILQPGQTPVDLIRNGGTNADAPNVNNIPELANRYAIYVNEVYQNLPQYRDTIAGWEVGNEPNMGFQAEDGGYVVTDSNTHRYYAVSLANAAHYANYLAYTAKAIDALQLGYEVNVIGGGIAHNDVPYLNTYLSTLSQKLTELGTSVDGISIHPYTTYIRTFTSPESGRPTVWVDVPEAGAHVASWDYHYSFQGALYNVQRIMLENGFDQTDLWITEFGVPSYLGYRNAGPDGELDQARWFAEAFGVLDSWGNEHLKGVIAHHVLDSHTFEYNAQFSAYDSNKPNGDVNHAEKSFGLFHKKNGSFTSKPAGWLMDYISNNRTFYYHNIISERDKSVLDASHWGSYSGIFSGFVMLTHDGNDTVTGSNHDDSIFGGSGNDVISGLNGNDRLYGGSGDDDIRGGGGANDIYGNDGNDEIRTSQGRVDGGRGFDTLVLSANPSSYSITGDAIEFTISGSGQSIRGRDVERIQFADNSFVDLSNADVGRGNGFISAQSTIDAQDDPNNNVTYGQTITIPVLNNDTTTPDTRITQINGIDMQPGWATWANGAGLVYFLHDQTLALEAYGENYSFTYTISDGIQTDVATVSGTIYPATAPNAVDDPNHNVAYGARITIPVLDNDSDPNGDTLQITQINGIDMQPGWQTWANGAGLVYVRHDHKLELEAYGENYSFTYTVSDGTETDVATVSGTISSQ
ncbi:putative Glycoside hydrolase fused with Serralysin-like metalloprotease [Vibrio nigripulchritudo SOn1]|uniref:Glycoside hydrolase fused with Serralysin-like metalloprotease n=1 Tax=Vibrio nigripulchritudo SOn1 TaxID=1238450 RepID=A0AAV2VX28_9VIBR|nr:Ig-like domain-containing protein [Vibrio nigripulchritudo]CCO49312.1 putative Glycoside hydrolase fused with Serralysin-like metalloprotease [Vibrio nigripulchritudo SOn1]